MSSWVCHVAGLPVEELSRQLVQVLGKACRPESWVADLPPGQLEGSSGLVVRDSQGLLWDCGTPRAKQIDSVGRALAELEVAAVPLPRQNGGASVRESLTPKLRLASMRVTSGPQQALLLPDLAEVHGDLGSPLCVYASDGPPGLAAAPPKPGAPRPAPPAAAAAPAASSSSPGGGVAPQASTSSASQPVTAAASATAQTTRSMHGAPSVSSGQSLPATASKTAPAASSSAVMATATSSAKASPMMASTTTKAHGNPRPGGAAAAFAAALASRVYNPRISSAYDIMMKRRVKSKVPDYISLAVPCCRLSLGRKTDTERPGLDPAVWPRFVSAVVLGGRLDATIFPSRYAAAPSFASSSSSTEPRTTTWRAKDGERLVLDFHGVPARGPRRAKSHTLKQLLEYLDEYWVAKVRGFPVAWSLLWVETLETAASIRELKWEAAPGRGYCPCCHIPLLCVARGDTKAPKSAANNMDAPSARPRTESVGSSANGDDAAKESERLAPGEVKDEAKVVAFELGQLPCSRCSASHRRTGHALVCPYYGRRCFQFRPLCTECRCVLDHIASEAPLHLALGNDIDEEDMFQGLPSPSGSSATDAEETNDTGLEERDPSSGALIPSDSPLGEDSFSTAPSMSAAGSRMSPTVTNTGDSADTEMVVLAAELSLELNVTGVPAKRQKVFLETLLDELRRVLGIPRKQMVVLQDQDCLEGIVQIGLLHPDLLAVRAPEPGMDRHCSFGLRREDLFDVPVEDLTVLWQRLALAVEAGSGDHRFGKGGASTGGYELLRHLRHGSLRWRSAIVAPGGSAGRRLIEGIKRIQEARESCEDVPGDDGFDDGASVDWSGDDREARAARATFASEEDGAPREVSKRSVGDKARIRKSVYETWLPASGAAEEKGGATEGADGAAFTVRIRGSNLRKVKPFTVEPLPDTEALLMEASRKVLNRVSPPDSRRRGLEGELIEMIQDVVLRPPATEIAAAATTLPLHTLAWQGDAAGMKEALMQATPQQLNAPDRQGRRLLHIAAGQNFPELLGLLAALGRGQEGPVKLEALDRKGRTALHYAVLRNSLACAAHLVSAAAGHGKLDIPEPRAGDTALHLAVRSASSAIVRLLVNAFALPDAQNKRGLTALHYAAANGDLDSARHLLRGGARAEALDAVQRTPANWAVQHGHTAMVALLLEGPSKEFVEDRKEAAEVPMERKDSVKAPAEEPPLRQHLLQPLQFHGKLWEGTTVSSSSSSSPASAKAAAAAPATARLTQETSPKLRRGTGGGSEDGKAVPPGEEIHDAELEGTRTFVGAGGSALTAEVMGSTWPGNCSSLHVRWRGWSQAANMTSSAEDRKTLLRPQTSPNFAGSVSSGISADMAGVAHGETTAAATGGSMTTTMLPPAPPLPAIASPRRGFPDVQGSSLGRSRGSKLRGSLNSNMNTSPSGNNEDHDLSNSNLNISINSNVSARSGSQQLHPLQMYFGAGSRKRRPPLKLATVLAATAPEAPEGLVAEVCESLGGDFCPRCWEYVLNLDAHCD